MRRSSSNYHEIVWAGKRWPSLEYCNVRKESLGWRITGVIVMVLKARRLGVHYEIVVGDRFDTRSLLLEKTELGIERRRLIQRRHGAWLVDGRERGDLAECVDVDIEASPVTNTLPIRRARLKEGQKADLIVAWVRFPSLEVVSARQSYERLSSRNYMFRSSGFAARLKVDAFGLVTQYGNLWREVK